MDLFLIATDDRPGTMARLLEAAARRHVNVAPAYGLSDGTRGLIALGSDDEAGLKAAIADAGFEARAYEMVLVDLDNRPGTGAEVTRKLADAGVNLHLAVPVGMSGERVQFGFAADDPVAVRRALGL